MSSIIRWLLFLREDLASWLGVSCLLYGGVVDDGHARICLKPRWHTDSHAYTVVRDL